MNLGQNLESLPVVSEESSPGKLERNSNRFTLEFNATTPLRNSLDLSESPLREARVVGPTEQILEFKEEEVPESKQEEAPEVPELKPTKSLTKEEAAIQKLRSMTMEVGVSCLRLS